MMDKDIIIPKKSVTYLLVLRYDAERAKNKLLLSNVHKIS